MNEDRMDVLTAIRRRMSVRSYGDRTVEPALLERLLALAGTADHLTEVPPRAALVSGVERTHRILTYMIGFYGLVQNPPHLLVGVLPEESGAARLDLGYVLEQVVLEATRLGLGTCWVTGSYDAQRAGEAVGLAPGEVAAAVCALGYPDEGRWGRFHSRTVRQLAGGHRRKLLAEIVFSGRWGEPWSPDGADPALVGVLEYARLAPSASNRQPWRFIVGPDRAVLALVRAAPIDGGIVMAHFALASAALGRAGQWEVRLGDATLARECKLPKGVIPVATFDLISIRPRSARPTQSAPRPIVERSGG
ncbi:MAG: nitroreductase family protein [Anaerolineae bacterium]